MFEALIDMQMLSVSPKWVHKTIPEGSEHHWLVLAGTSRARRPSYDQWQESVTMEPRGELMSESGISIVLSWSTSKYVRTTWRTFSGRFPEAGVCEIKYKYRVTQKSDANISRKGEATNLWRRRQTLEDRRGNTLCGHVACAPKAFLTYFLFLKGKRHMKSPRCCVSPFKFLTSCPIFTKCDTNVTLLEGIPTSYFVIPTISNNNMADARTREAGATQAPLNIGSWNCVVIYLLTYLLIHSIVQDIRKADSHSAC
jgi:hypothetical protein